VRRRNRPELMDQPEVPEGELATDLRNLAWINALLGGIAVVRAHWPKSEQWAVGSGQMVAQLAPLTVLDVATGGGDIPRWLARRESDPVFLVAGDLHPQMLALARRWSAGLPVRFLRLDARRLPFPDRSVDVVLCSLMLHHLSEADAVEALRELARVARRRLIVNDLRRSRMAYVLIWLITRFSRNPLTRYDSPVSVERAFTPAELMALAREAGLEATGRFRIHRHLFYRMALVYEPK
jgi:ubiquinone/menaquinone biosynthesis C-methylase UbiE